MCKIEKGESGLALVADRHAWIDALLAVLGSERMDRRAWIGVLLVVLGSETERVDRRLWQISVLGSECLDRRSSRRAWIGVLLDAVLPTWIEISKRLE